MNPLPNPVSTDPATNNATVAPKSAGTQNRSGVETAVATGATQNSAACCAGDPHRRSITTTSASMTTDMDTGNPVKNSSHPAPYAEAATSAPVWPPAASV